MKKTGSRKRGIEGRRKSIVYRNAPEGVSALVPSSATEGEIPAFLWKGPPGGGKPFRLRKR